MTDFTRSAIAAALPGFICFMLSTPGTVSSAPNEIAQLATCTTCRGTGNGPFKCSLCKGSGRSGSFQCGFCKGTGWQRCSQCKGSGSRLSTGGGADRRISGGTSSKPTICSQCKGTGNGPFKCTQCKGTGRNGSFQCSFCTGTGWQRCNSCSASRFRSSTGSASRTSDLKKTAPKICANCRGTGNGPFKCSLCKGTGRNGNFQCSFCTGTGWQRCSQCKGSGRR